MYLHFLILSNSLFYNVSLIVHFKAQTNKAFQWVLARENHSLLVLANRKHSELIETDITEHMISFPLTQIKLKRKLMHIEAFSSVLEIDLCLFLII